MDKKETEKVERYLVEVVNRLFDTQHVLEGIQLASNTEKYELVKAGQDFRYQQAVLDISTELYRYATGEDNLQEILEKIVEEQRKIRKEMQGGNAMEVQ